MAHTARPFFALLSGFLPFSLTGEFLPVYSELKQGLSEYLTKGGDAVDNHNKPCYPMGVARRLSGLSERQIRYWEEQGIVTPARSHGGHRLYSQADLDLLTKAALMRQRGHGLDEILAAQATLPPAPSPTKPGSRVGPSSPPRKDPVTKVSNPREKPPLSPWRNHFPATTHDRLRVQTEMDRRRKESHSKKERD